MFNIFSILNDNFIRQENTTRPKIILFVTKETASLLNRICSRFSYTIARHICNSKVFNRKATVQHICANQYVRTTPRPIYFLVFSLSFISTNYKLNVRIKNDIINIMPYFFKRWIWFIVFFIQTNSFYIIFMK